MSFGLVRLDGFRTPKKSTKQFRYLVSVITLSFLYTFSTTSNHAAGAPSSSPSCEANAGKGGAMHASNVALTKAGNGCVVIKYVSSSTTYFETFNYTGSEQDWIVPSDVTSATFYLIGAGGGGALGVGQAGGGGGYATGSYTVTPGTTLKIIVGQGGGGVAGAAVTGKTGKYSNLTYGGGGRGGSLGGGNSGYGSGGGRSAIRLASGTTDIATAAGGGGGSWSQCGAGGGGTSGVALTGNAGGAGTQIAGGAGGLSNNSGSVGGRGTAGAAYLGGDSQDEGGGGGGGFYGGGGGGDNGGGGGGSSYIALLTSGLTTSGASCGAAAISTGLSYTVTYDSNNATSGSVPSASTVTVSGGSLTLPTNSGNLARTNFTFSGWNTQANGTGTSYATGATTFIPAADTTLYAQWSSTITYNGNGNTSGTVPTATTIIGTASNATLATTTTVLKSNYTFDGWNTSADGTGTSYAAGLNTYASTGSRTLYAQWKATITFDGNAKTSGTVPNPSVVTTATTTLPSNAGSLARTGYVFGGWNTLANGSGTKYAASSTYTVTGTRTLYAHWVPLCSPTRVFENGYHRFTFSTVGECSWTIPNGVTTAEVLLVAGGGSGSAGIASYYWPAGGGGGEVISDSNVALTPGASVFVEVGAGGAAVTSGAGAEINNGKASVFGSLVARGGKTANNILTGNAGATGGASGNGNAGGFGGTNGSYGCGVANCGAGGGGGAGGAGSGLNGGAGVTSSISGTSLAYGGGGAGHNGASGTATAGGATQSVDALPNRGGGGAYLKAGGSGIVIVRYLGAPSTITYNTSGGNASTPASQTQSVASDVLTLASYSGTKGSKKFMNWNTAADGNGTNYAAGGTLLPVEDITLYAVWMDTYCPENWTWTEPVCTKNYPSTGNFIIPWGFASLDVIAVGGSGGNGSRGSGGVAGKIQVKYGFTRNDDIKFFPGGKATGVTGGVDSYPGGNYNGGTGLTNNGGSGGGGAGTIVTKNGEDSSKIIMVAGGGGGGGATWSCASGFYSSLGGNPTANGEAGASSNSLTYGSNGYNHGWNRFSGAGGGGNSGGNYGGATQAWNDGCGSSNGGTGLGGYRGGNSTTGGASTVFNGANNTAGIDGYVTLQLTRSMITYNSNGGSGTVPAKQIQTSEAEDLTVSSTNITRTGYTLNGWNTAADGTGTNYSAGATYNLPAAITLYAKWTANPYEVIYDTSTVTSGTMANTALTAGTAFTLRTNAFARVGHTFKNWNTAANGSGTTYTNAQSVTLYSGLTLYPQWNLIAPGVPTVTTSAGNTEVTVTPTPVAASGTTVGPTTSMLVTAFNSSSVALSPAKTCTVVLPATSCVISGLTNGVTYKFAAKAINATSPTGTTNSSLVNGIPAGVVVSYRASDNGGIIGTSGTTGTSTATFNKGTPLTLPVASRTGYVFSGWYTTQSSGGALVGAAAATYSPTSAITLYARFSGIVYTINYNGNGNTGGTVPSTGSYETGSGAHVVGAGPTKVGYTFAGWNTAANGSGTSYSATTSITPSSDITLFAQWTAASRTVTYALDGGTSTATTTQLTGKVVGNTITLPASNTMSKTGYSFAGWSDGTNTYAGGATWTVPASDSNFTLTALWNTQTLTYSYDTNGGGTAPDGGTKTYGQTLVLASSTGLSKTGYSFAGWNDGSTTSNAGASVSITTNKIFVAQWSAQSFSITYDGNSSSSGSVTAGSYVAGGVPYAIAANGFTRAGYNFAGWHTTAGGTGGTDYVAGAGYSTAVNLVLYAKWTPASYTITYNGNGSTGGNVPSSGTLTTGTTFNADNNSGSLVKTGYTFASWNTNAAGTGTSIAANGVVTTTSNLTLYAQWTIISPLIAFNDGAATEPLSVFPNSTSAQYGSIYTLPAIDTSTVISLVNHAFTGWSDGTAVYQVGSSYRMGSANVTFTAQWVAIYTVRYVLNGGTGTVPSDQLRANDFRETLTSATVAKAGYSLSGWKDQSGVTIPSGANNWVISGTSYIAYAQWTATPRTLSFDQNGGSASQASITNKYIGDLEVLPTPTFTKTGYTFSGWLNSGVTYPGGGTFTVGDGDSAFTAVWVGNINTITYNGNGATSGTAPSNGTYVTGGSTYTIESNSGTLAKTGFSFAGWNTAANGSGDDKAENATGFTTTSDITLYAKWSAASFVVTYDPANSSSSSTETKMYGSSFTLPVAPTKAGNNFLGWELTVNSVANIYAPGSTFTMGSSAITFTAKWTGIYYAVTYALNGGAGTAPTQANVASGGSFTTAAAPTKSGFTFAGWSDGATTTNAATSITNVSGNTTLTAQWTIAAPGIPGAPTATPGNGSATITIAAPTTGGTPSSYTVTASPGGATCTVTAPGTSCTIAPLTNGTAYTFTSTATNTAGTSTSGSTASTAITPAGVPLSPSSITGTGLGGSTTIEWIAPSSDGGSPITDYVIEYSVAGSGTWTTFSDGTSTATSATITGLTAGNAYEFRVSAKNLIGNSLPSFISPVVESLPTAPTISAVTGGSEKVTVAWNASSHLGSGTLTDYEVTAYDPAGNVAGTCNPASGQRTCEVTGLDNGSSYTFKVAAITSVGSSAQSSASSVVIPAGVPSAPANVTAVTTGSNMTVTFDAPADNGGSAITSYVVTSSPSGATCTRGANATTYTCTGLTAGTNYTYSVKAVNSKGESTSSLDSTAVTAVAVPSAPQGVSAVITAGTTTLSATVSFNPPSSENGSPVTSYTVTASPGGATCTVTAPTTYCEILVLPDRAYTFTVTATNAVGTSVSSSASLETKAANGIKPTLVVDPIPAPTGDLAENKVLSSNITFADYNSTPNSVVTYQWKRCTDPLDDTTCTNISGATSATYTLGSSDVDKYIRVQTTATNSIDSLTSLSDATAIITAAPVSNPTTPSTPSTPTPSAPVVDSGPPSCDASCQSIRDAAATKAAADAAAKAAADKLAADAAAKLKADADARTASDKAAAAAKAAADAAKTAVEKAGAAAAAKAAADAAAAAAAAQAKAAADAQAAANRAAAAAQAALKNSAASAAAKAAATASANKAAADAAAAVKAAATAAQNATKAKTAEANANKQVDIAINSLSSKTASAQATAEANAIAAAAKAAANEAAAAAAAKAETAKATASAAQKAAADAAARISTEQKEAAAAAAAAKAAADTAAKASAEKIAATNAAKVATENLVKVLNEKATLAEEAAKTTDSAVREEIAKKIEEIETKLEEVEAAAEEAVDAAEEATTEFEEAQEAATEAQEVAAEEAQDAVEIKTEAATKSAAATKAVANASVAAKVATAAKAAAAKVPSKAVIKKPTTTTGKNTAKATVTGLKPGQKVKVTVNVKGK